MTNETTASQPKSIGDDAQFLDWLKAWSHEYENRLRDSDVDDITKQVAAYIDSRAPAAQASATIQAAPVAWRRATKHGWEFRSLPPTERMKSDGWSALILPDAATIQEPVMVAEPVGYAHPISFLNLSMGASSNEWMWAKQDAGMVALYRAAPMVADPAGVAWDYATMGIPNEEVTDMWRAAGHSGTVPFSFANRIQERMQAALAATVKAVPSEALDAAPRECWSDNQEDYNADSLGDLLDNNENLKAGDTVWVGEAEHPESSELIDADDVMTTMSERADDIAGEHADGYPDVTKEAEQELDDILAGWIAKHCAPNFWRVVNVKPYVLSADDFLTAPLTDKTDGGE